MHCSPEQRMDWSNHRKVCTKLDADRNDKTKIAEMAKR